MLIELHCHTSRYSSCSTLGPVDALRRAEEMGLWGLVITEHEVLWTPEELEALRQEAEVGDHLVLFAAQEVETDLGHVLVVGATRSLPGRYTLETLRKDWPEAALLWAHPFRHRRQPTDEELTHEALDGVEIFNSNHTALAHFQALTSWHRLRFVATAGSDAHAAHTVGRYPSELDHPVATVEELAAEIRAGRIRPFVKEIPRAGTNQRVTEIVVGTKGPDERRERLIVRRVPDAMAWRRLEHGLNVTLGLRKRGLAEGRYRVPALLEVDRAERVVVEESQRGKLLYDLLVTVSAETRERYMTEVMHWLARLHASELRVGHPRLTLARERRRALAYTRAFLRSRNPYHGEVQLWAAGLLAHEEALLGESDDGLCQTHGDFHPKNVILGQDLSSDPETLFVSVIDFAGSLVHHPAFDLGYLFAQLRHQLRGHPELRSALRAEALLGLYQEARQALDDPAPADLAPELPWFELRGLLSIASFLIKVGKGVSPEMDDLMSRARALADAVGLKASPLEAGHPLA